MMKLSLGHQKDYTFTGANGLLGIKESVDPCCKDDDDEDDEDDEDDDDDDEDDDVI